MGISEDLKEIKDELKSQKEEKEQLKNKRWKLRKAKVGKKKQNKNWIGIMKINENGSIEPSKQQIVQQTVVIDDVPRLATPDYVLRWNAGRKQFPLLIIPSWSVEPLSPKSIFFSPTESIEESIKKGTNIKGYQLLLARMKANATEVKKKVGGWVKWLIGIGVGAIIVYVIYQAVTGGLK